MDPNDRRSNVSASSTSFEARLSVLNNRTHAQQNKTEQNRTKQNKLEGEQGQNFKV